MLLHCNAFMHRRPHPFIAGVPVPVTERIPHELPPPPGVNLEARLDHYFWLRSDARNDTAVLSHLQASGCRSRRWAAAACAAASLAAAPSRHPSLPSLPAFLLPQEENAYAEAVLAPSLPLQEQLLAEMLARVPQEEASVPQRRGRHWYAQAAGTACCAAQAFLPLSLRPLQAWSVSFALPFPPPSPTQRYYSVHSAGHQYRRYCRRPLDDPDALPSEHDVMNATAPEEVLLDQDRLAGGCCSWRMLVPLRL